MIKVGIIGCGSITKFRHAPDYSANSNVEIGGFFNPTRARAEEMAAKYGGRVYETYEEMLADQSIDAVSVCSPNITHAPITIAALNAGKHVLCEKPMATSVEDAKKMNEAAEKSGKILMIANNLRRDPAYKLAKKILSGGDLGKIISFRTELSHGGPEGWSAEKSAKTWFFNKENAVMGALGDLGIHKADIIRWLIGEEFTEVSAHVATLDKHDVDGNLIGVDDNAVCIMISKSGIHGTLTASWSNYGDMDNSTIIYCTNGVLKICSSPEYSVEVKKRNGEAERYKTQGIEVKTEGSNSIIDSFVESIVKGTPPEVPGEEGLADLKIIDACMRSSRTGKRELI